MKMKKLIIVLIILFFSCVGNAQLNKYDWLSYSYSDIGFSYACSYYVLKNAGFSDLSENKINSVGISKWNINKGNVKNTVLEWENIKYYNITIDDYKIIQNKYECKEGWVKINSTYFCGIIKQKCDKIITNKTSDDLCFFNIKIKSGSHKIIKNKTIWSKFDSEFKAENIKIYPQKSKNFRICSDIERVVTDRGMTIEVDHVPKFDIYDYPKWVWWNDSYKYKFLLNCSNMTDKTPIIINGSNGFMLNNSIQLIWTYCNGVNTSIYFNNASDLVVANTTNQLPHEYEIGNGTDYLNTSIWNNGCWHYDILNPPDSSGTYSVSQSFLTRNVNSFIGKGNYYSGGGNYTNLQNVPFLDSWTISFWVNASNTAAYQRIVRKDYVFMIYISDSTTLIYRGTGSAWGTYLEWTTDFTTNNYEFFTFIFDSSINSYTIFKNSISQGSYSMSPPVNNNNILFTGRMASGSINSTLDEFRFYDYILSDNEIKEQYYNTIYTSGYGDLYGFEVFTTTTTITPISSNFIYDGYKSIIIQKISGNQTHLNHSNSTNLNLSHDFFIILNELQIEKSKENLLEKIKEIFNQDFRYGFAILTIIFLLFIIFFMIIRIK